MIYNIYKTLVICFQWIFQLIDHDIFKASRNSNFLPFLFLHSVVTRSASRLFRKKRHKSRTISLDCVTFILAEKPGTNVAKDMKEERDGSLGRRNGKWYPAARLELVNNFRPSTRVVSHFELKEILTRRKWKKCKTIEMDKCSHAYKSSNTLQGCCFCENKKLRNCTSKLV